MQASAATAIDPATYRAVMRRFASGVTVVSHLREGMAAGMTANAFLSVSMEPPLVLVSVRRQSAFNAQVRPDEVPNIALGWLSAMRCIARVIIGFVSPRRW